MFRERFSCPEGDQLMLRYNTAWWAARYEGKEETWYSNHSRTKPILHHFYSRAETKLPEETAQSTRLRSQNLVLFPGESVASL